MSRNPIQDASRFEKAIDGASTKITVAVADYNPKTNPFGPSMVRSLKALIAHAEDNITRIEAKVDA